MSNPMAPFLKAGLTHYPAAVEAVILFEKEVQQALEKAAESSRDWAPLIEHDLGSRGAGSERGTGCWIYRTIAGRTKSRMNVEIDSGLWWGAPVESPVILYSRFREPDGIRLFQAPASKHVRYFIDGKDAYLASEVPENLVLTEILNRHLDIMLGVVKRYSGRNGAARRK